MSVRRVLRAAALLLVVAWPSGSVLGQTLGELADSTKKRRKGGVPAYSDEDLKKRQPGPSPSPGVPAPDAAPVASDGAGGGSSESGGGGDGGEGDEGRSSGHRNDESYWRQQAAQLRANIKEAERGVEVAERRLNALMSDLVPTNVGDPFQQQTLEADRAKARAELGNAEVNLERAEDLYDEFKEEARRKSVPPGWLEER